MKITLNNEELQELYNITKNAKSPIANKLWNSVFGNHPHKLISTAVDNGHTTIDIDEVISVEILKEFTKHSFGISNVLSSSKNPFTIFTSLKSISDEMGNKLSKILK